MFEESVILTSHYQQRQENIFLPLLHTVYKTRWVKRFG